MIFFSLPTPFLILRIEKSTKCFSTVPWQHAIKRKGDWC